MHKFGEVIYHFLSKPELSKNVKGIILSVKSFFFHVLMHFENLLTQNYWIRKDRSSLMCSK